MLCSLLSLLHKSNVLWTDMLTLIPFQLKDWDMEMVRYFKDKWKDFEIEGEEVQEDVIDEYDGIASFVKQNEMGNSRRNVLVEERRKKTRQKEVRNFMMNENLNLCAILETHLKVEKVNDISLKVFGNWHWASNAIHCKRGCRIIIGWDQNMLKVMVVHSSDQAILCLIEDMAAKVKIYCTFIYASNDGRERRKLWRDLNVYNHITNGKPWCLMGDVNVTLSTDEHSDGMSYSSSKMQEFQDCINAIEVEDLKRVGFHFTWTKRLKNPNSSTLKKLDRVLGNRTIMDIYPSAYAEFLPYLVSDQSPALLFIPRVLKKKSRSFKFSNFIVDKEEFFLLVQKEWEANISGSVSDEEKVLYQQAKVEWLKEGDKNSAYFHQVIKGRRHMNHIESVYVEQGKRFSGEYVKEQFVIHSEKFLGIKGNTKQIENFEELFLKKVYDQEAEFMCREVTYEEIKRALDSIHDNKAPGPDGYTSKFFKATWSIVGNDVCKDVKEYFRSGKLLGEINATLISLVPKMKAPTKVSDYRPTACCNVVYKIISKVLTIRLKNVLCRIISQSQSAFIPGRY
ncbi:RNA-directed DNA polymerase, eukaryota, reverse transcriptase zinc-binding domain protein [Tanacetum coccineum]